jgi:hypothetical protein
LFPQESIRKRTYRFENYRRETLFFFWKVFVSLTPNFTAGVAREAKTLISLRNFLLVDPIPKLRATGNSNVSDNRIFQF